MVFTESHRIESVCRSIETYVRMGTRLGKAAGSSDVLPVEGDQLPEGVTKAANDVMSQMHVSQRRRELKVSLLDAAPGKHLILRRIFICIYLRHLLHLCCSGTCTGVRAVSLNNAAPGTCPCFWDVLVLSVLLGYTLGYTLVQAVCLVSSSISPRSPCSMPPVRACICVLSLCTGHLGIFICSSESEWGYPSGDIT